MGRFNGLFFHVQWLEGPQTKCLFPTTTKEYYIEMGRDYSSTILHLDALAAAINFGISFNFDGDSFRKALEIVA